MLFTISSISSSISSISTVNGGTITRNGGINTSITNRISYDNEYIIKIKKKGLY